MRQWLFLLCLVLHTGSRLCSQSHPAFDVRLVLNVESAEKTLGLYEGLSGWGGEIARLRGSQIAMATTGLLANRNLTTSDLERALDAAKFAQISGDDVFRLMEARENVRDIKELLGEIKRRGFGQRVVSTVEQLFPANSSIATTIPVYFVAFGHHNIDAYVRRVTWRGDTPVFVGEGEGELTIVVNLAKGVHYGRTIEERFVGTLAVVAHEVFHAAFGVYKDSSPAWQAYNASHRSYLDRLLDLTQNEGIAHYLTFDQRSRGRLPTDWHEKVRVAFEQFNRNAERLLSRSISRWAAEEVIRTSNTSGFWESYGAITGLFIAREIDKTLGRVALAETVAKGPADFFNKYSELTQMDGALPLLSPLVFRAIQK